MSIEERVRESMRERAGAVRSAHDRWPEIEEGGPPEVQASGRRGAHRVITVVVALALFAASAVLVWSAFRPTTHRMPAAPATPYRLPSGELVEPMREQEEAEVFAFRAVAATGLMDPHGARSFGFTYRDDTTRTGSGWRVGFATMDCAPRKSDEGLEFTCTGLSGEDPNTGNAVTDAYVTVALDGGTWEVTGLDGNVLDAERERLVGYSLPQQAEPSHWEFPAVGAWHGKDDIVTGFASVALWVGPYPTTARGSVCDARALAADGADLGSLARWYEEAPDRSFERAGWVISRGVADPPQGMVSAAVTCVQYTGDGWEVVGAPELVRQGGDVVGVRIPLEWQGEEGITTPAACEVEVLSQSGSVVWQGRGRAEAFEPKDDYPYHTQVFVPGPLENPPGADHVGSFSCRSL